MKCIYCSQEKNAKDFSSKEHVIPDALGTFGAGANTPTLINCVCKECNQYFGNKLEVACIRYSYLELFRSGLFGTLKYQDPKIKPKAIKTSSFLDIKAAHNKEMKDKLSLTLHTENKSIDLENSISFRLDETGDQWAQHDFQYLKNHPELVKELKQKLSSLTNKTDAIYIVCDSDETLKTISDFLQAAGFDFKPSGKINPIEDILPSEGSLLTEITIKMDARFYRFIAKIAFNYFVKYACDNLHINIHDKSIDGLRAFIREGKKYEHESSFKPISESKIKGQDDRARFPNCFHLVCLENINGALNAYVNLYNSIGYSFVLFRANTVASDYCIGHHFDFIHKEVGLVTFYQKLKTRLYNIGILPVLEKTSLPGIKSYKRRIVLPTIKDLLRWGK
jgi:hypothetical protein